MRNDGTASALLHLLLFERTDVTGGGRRMEGACIACKYASYARWDGRSLPATAAVRDEHLF